MGTTKASEYTWDAEVLREYPDGLRLVRMTSAEDLKQLGEIQGHCSAVHKFWAVADPPLEYFFVMLNEEGYPLNTLHCKVAAWVGVEHPLDKDPEAMAFLAKQPVYSFLHTRYYDEYVDGTHPVAQGRNWVNPNTQRLEQAKRRYQDLRREALKLGPLGKDHPYKAALDDANRDIGRWEKYWKEAELSAVTARGRTFEYDGHGIVILSATGRGLDGIRAEKYAAKWDEFLGKEVEVAFGTAG